MSVGVRPDTSATCERAQLSSQVAAQQLVRDVMLPHPKTLPVDASVADVRRLFANPKVVSTLLADGTAFAGALGRGDIPAAAPDAAPARRYARRDVPTVSPDEPMRRALDLLESNGWDRLVVLEPDGVSLAGLLCLDRQRAGFCRE